MNFNVNHPALFILSFIIVLYVIFQSVLFLIRAWKRALELRIDSSDLKRVVKASAVFTIAPAIAILIGLITLSKFLGLPLPWLRLSVLGALTYELPAAASVSNILNLSMDMPVNSVESYLSITWVMTLGILSGIIIIAFFQKKMQSGLTSMREKNGKWTDYLVDSLFIGMISAFLGMIFSEVGSGIIGWIPVFVALFSAFLMIIQGLMIKKMHIKWLENYALPFSMVGAMIFAVVLTNSMR